MTRSIAGKPLGIGGGPTCAADVGLKTTVVVAAATSLECSSSPDSIQALIVAISAFGNGSFSGGMRSEASSAVINSTIRLALERPGTTTAPPVLPFLTEAKLERSRPAFCLVSPWHCKQWRLKIAAT